MWFNRSVAEWVQTINLWLYVSHDNKKNSFQYRWCNPRVKRRHTSQSTANSALLNERKWRNQIEERSHSNLRWAVYLSLYDGWHILTNGEEGERGVADRGAWFTFTRSIYHQDPETIMTHWSRQNTCTNWLTHSPPLLSIYTHHLWVVLGIRLAIINESDTDMNNVLFPTTHRSQGGNYPVDLCGGLSVIKMYLLLLYEVGIIRFLQKVMGRSWLSSAKWRGNKSLNVWFNADPFHGLASCRKSSSLLSYFISSLSSTPVLALQKHIYVRVSPTYPHPTHPNQFHERSGQ